MDAQQRFEFFEFVRDQWGPDRAGQLMDMLPPANASELVTTDQLQRAIAEQGRALSDRIADTNRLIADQTRTIMIAMVTLWASGIALAFTAARLAG